MLPLTFDRHVLTSPLLDYDDATGRLMKVLRVVVDRRVLPRFAKLDDVDPVHFARACERYSLSRMEDVRGQHELVSLVSKREGGWTVHIHERIFDYFAFGLPLDPDHAFESPTREARKVLALAEFVLRHEFDHVVRPFRDEAEVLETIEHRDPTDAEVVGQKHDVVHLNRLAPRCRSRLSTKRLVFIEYIHLNSTGAPLR